MQHDIQIKLALPEGKDLVDVSDAELATALNAEIDTFEIWFKAQGNEPLVGFERSLLRTFLAWKSRYEENGTDTED
jgi:hypothetical protein